MYHLGSDTNRSVVVKYNNTRSAFVIGKIPDIMDVSQIDPNHPPYPQLSVFAETGYFEADFEGSDVYSFNQPVTDANSNGPYTAALEFDSRFRVRDASQEPIYTFPGPRPPVTLISNNMATWNDASAVAGDSILKLEANGALNLYSVYGDLIKTFFQDSSAIPSKNYFLSLTPNGALLLKDVNDHV
ncbi:hypothetical protein HDU77_010443 [Chytriomyces hyalinus]|nr:hypothetical protein HDU77_010443 [Chytriomyces hyalinus]